MKPWRQPPVRMLRCAVLTAAQKRASGVAGEPFRLSCIPVKKNKSHRLFAELQRIRLLCWPLTVSGDTTPVPPRNRWVSLCFLEAVESTSPLSCVNPVWHRV